MQTIFSVFMWLVLAGVAICRPPVTTGHGNFSTESLSSADRAWLIRHMSVPRVDGYPAGFQTLYLGHHGRIVNGHKPSEGSWIQFVGSPLTSLTALYRAARDVGRMLRYAPPHLHENIANHPGSGVGIFTAAETITIFPEFYEMTDTPECRDRCDEPCEHTCTPDGHKYETLSSITTTKSFVLMENVMCSSDDPENKRRSLLIQEFAHTIKNLGIDSHERAQLTAAYDHARNHQLWRPGSSAMSNQEEYFAEATGAFFLVNLQSTPGGMNECSPDQLCTTEVEARHHIQSQDPHLSALLNGLYTSGDLNVPSGLTVCPDA